ncbi:MAG: glycosyltransferase [Gammaproteobacteria bacterium]|nr:glycosyltransferase [Gammaproteobacteria bacterium]
MNSNPKISFSVVSHGQANLIRDLLSDLAELPCHDFEVIVTLNLPEDESLYLGFDVPLKIIRNESPKGFGGNHNAAFLASEGLFFSVVNPDIRIQSLDFLELLLPFSAKNVAAVAPLVYSASGTTEDSARRFPTFFRLFKRVVLRHREPDYTPGNAPLSVDWVAGMFVVFRKDVFRNLGGFDDRRFFMYMEDVDICRRINKAGFNVLLNPKVSVVHLAQRASHRNLKYMRWHVVSAFRYLTGF